VGIGFAYYPARKGANYSEFVLLGLGVIGANMQCKLFVALQLKVAHHFIERCPGERTRRFEPPATFGATKTSKTLLLNPYQLPAHGRHIAAPQRCLTGCLVTARQGTKRSPFAAAYCLIAAEKPSLSLGVEEDA